MALKITNQLLHLPNEVHISRVQTHEHSYEIFIDFPAPCSLSGAGGMSAGTAPTASSSHSAGSTRPST
jgi:hypothetical protein